MKLKQHIELNHYGVQSKFAESHGKPPSRINELLKSKNEAYVFEHEDENGNMVKSVFKHCWQLKGDDE